MARLVERDGVGIVYEPRRHRRGRCGARCGPHPRRRDAAPRRERSPRGRSTPRRSGRRSCAGLGPLMCGICGVVALDRPAEADVGSLDARRAAAPRARRGGPLRGAGRRARPHAARDHRPLRRRPTAVRERRRRAPAAAQRRGLQLPRAACPARGSRALVPDGDRHRGRAPRLRGVGAALRRAVQRHVGARALGRARAAALLLARPLRDQAVRLHLRRPPPRVRERAASAAQRPVLRRAAESARGARLPRAGPHGSSRRDVLRRDAAAAARALARARRERAPPRALLAARARRSAGGRGRGHTGALPRLDPAAPAERRAARHRPLRRARLLGRRGRDRPPAAHRGRERTARRRPPAHVHGLLRRRRLRRAPVRRGRRRTDPRRAALDLVRGGGSSWTSCRGSWPTRASRSARRASSRSGS